MFKQPKVDKEKYQIEIDQDYFRGDKEKYSEAELKVYSSRRRSNSEEFVKNKIQKTSFALNERPKIQFEKPGRKYTEQ